jgi:hypothetical protein
MASPPASNVESLKIVLNPQRRTQLERKLEEYKSRMGGYSPPELQMDTVCKIEVLGRLLRAGTVDVFQLEKELLVRFGTAFDRQAFWNACAVIADYCSTGGANLSGGTGLSNDLQEIRCTK